MDRSAVTTTAGTLTSDVVNLSCVPTAATVDKKQYGYYIYMRFEGEGSIIKSLEKELRMDDRCLRFLTVLVPQSVIQEEKTRPETKPEETSIEMEEKVTPKDSSNDSEERQQPDTPEQSV